MPRNMSFFLTKEQVIKETKTVTRRLGWNHAKPGMYCWAVEKGQGIKKGEINRLKLIRIKSVKREKLFHLYINKGMEEAKLEGFPNMLDEQFATFFCEKMKCGLGQYVNRIEFEYVKDYSGRLVGVSNKEVNALTKHVIERVYQATGLLEWREDYDFFSHGIDLKPHPHV
ncbi:hypothetical protein [uncultured Algoriphagus sp.]|uniref:hypothetical protein n=1 Tax=uncultured Algoriphagus sp. TaxID=417365 RepID=UPI0025924C80|nr:hypothetical protein [uncultured Algoriphagus sp.]